MCLSRYIVFIYIFIVLILNIVSSHSMRLSQREENKVRNITINQTNDPTPKITPSKKWQVSRMTKRRYEIVNILWKKTKIFGDIESITDSTNNKISKRKREHRYPISQEVQKLTLALPYLRRSSSTPSYIAFNYLDVNDEIITQNGSNSINRRNNRAKYKGTRSVLNSPFFVFHVQYETCQSTQTPSITQLQLANRTFTDLFLAYLRTSPKKNAGEDITNIFDMETCPLTTLPSNTMNSPTDPEESQSEEGKKATTLYDKIKFFEIYDSNTPTPLNAIRQAPNTSKVNTTHASIDDNQNIFFDDVDFKTSMHRDYNKTRFVKKHIDKVISAEYVNEFYKQTSKELFTETPKLIMRADNDMEHSFNVSRPAAWSDFPFVAVYVYEPSQVRCDAAALSPHWLLAAASCLSRRYKHIYYVDGPSAYVAYCTDYWRRPERIAYVKHTFVHPKFDARDHTRRFLYNIGVIQIVNSMAETCNGWAPISLISHQFDANPGGSMGVAVGWGLDRYDASQPNVKHPLMVYENLVHSESCPGYSAHYISGYSELSKVKSYIMRDNDLYCLSLPNYAGENDDNGHGALLLIGGKLIALYLQEERRPSGGQSAQYTGVWRHIPWLLDTAREPEEFVTVSLDF